MLPRQYQRRYSVIFPLSILVHVAIVVILIANPVFEIEKHKEQEKTVTINLKPEIKEKKKKQQQQKQKQQKKQSQQKQEQKKQEQKKQEQKKQEQKKQEQKKQEQKKQEQKKQEQKTGAKAQKEKQKQAKKQESKQSKKLKTKDQEQSKAEGKKVKNKGADKQPAKKGKKQEAKKQEAKKQEAKKQEAKKQEAKKQEAKKQEAKKQEAKKQEAKKQKVKEQGAKQKGETQIADDVPDLYQDMMFGEQQPAQAPVKKDVAKMAAQKWGSMQQMDEHQMSRAVVYTGSLSQQDTARAEAGERVKKGLSKKHQQVFNATMMKSMKQISRHIQPPRWDGKKYYGEINFFVDQSGIIEKIVIKKSSGNDELDKSMVDALLKTYRLPLPNNRKVRDAFILTKKLLYYDERDMAR